MSDKNFATGAVRSSDADDLDFTSLPLIGLIAAARTAAEGARKYGRLNYMQGMPVHGMLNHVMRHITLYLLGDRSESHLAHATWGMMAAQQSAVLDPELSEPYLLGPGATLTEANRKELDDHKEELAFARQRGDFDKIGDWTIEHLPEVVQILYQRYLESEVTI